MDKEQIATLERLAMDLRGQSLITESEAELLRKAANNLRELQQSLARSQADAELLGHAVERMATRIDAMKTVAS